MKHPAPIIDLDLALQGGGSHGAFTWGVLDRLLSEPKLRIVAASGTSAGAVNAAALAAGLAENGPAGAQHKLKAIWEDIARVGALPGVYKGLPSVLADWMTPWAEPLQTWALNMQQWLGPWLAQPFSPYQLNPLNINPLRDVLLRHIDFAHIRSSPDLRLFISATQVRTGQLRIFRQHEVNVDVVMASACLPLLFQAVHIEGEAYWDGGFAGNPSLMPLLAESPAQDLMLVQINPKLRERVPMSTGDIVDRMNEVSFNASLLKELRSLALMKQLLQEEGRPTARYKHELFRRIDGLRVHRIDGEGGLNQLQASSKMDTRETFLKRLHDLGEHAADRWLHSHAKDLGVRSTLDLQEEFLE